ncbi:hypothetical protein SteCoe_13481 [Stentor coeruleus]|uniref:Uncharacterized protein n=1 Tax=Stentor coeruleus TaxID=5963 RepID=A0A1R2C8F9_9CILI|nr:hypothetical protein SteCoe_13481 [Stentor coeruleus]
MEDRSALLKIYNDRTIILNKGMMNFKDFQEYLDSKSMQVSAKFLSILISYSSVSGTIRPELLIESILQYLKGKRNYQKESLFLSSSFNNHKSLPWDDFRENFLNYFSNLYESNETSRILQLVKRFGLDHEEQITFEYLSQLTKTSNASKYDLIRCGKRFAVAFQKFIILWVWKGLKNKKVETWKGSFKFEEDDDWKNRFENNFKTAIVRKPLEIISNKVLSITTKDIDKKVKLELEESTNRNRSLRNKLFMQAYKSFSAEYMSKLVRECFFIVKNPYKSRNPYVHRAVFKMFLRLRNKANNALMNSMLKWNKSFERFNEFFQLDNSFFLKPKESSINLSKQFALQTLSAGLKERNTKIMSLLLQKNLKCILIKNLHPIFTSLTPNMTIPLNAMLSIFRKSHLLTLQKSFKSLEINAKIQQSLDLYTSKLNASAKRLKYSIPNKGRKIACRIIIKNFAKQLLRKKMRIYKENSQFKPRRMSQNLVKTPKISDFMTKPQGFSKSFKGFSKESPSNVTAKYEDMKHSFKRVRLHRGLEMVWIIYRNLQKKLMEKPCFRYFFTWKNMQTRRKMRINLATNKVGRPVHHSQFSFRDKY